ASSVTSSATQGHGQQRAEYQQAGQGQVSTGGTRRVAVAVFAGILHHGSSIHPSVHGRRRDEATVGGIHSEHGGTARVVFEADVLGFRDLAAVVASIEVLHGSD